MKVVFRIRTVYFDQIVAGTKTTEIRKASDYWRMIAPNVAAALSLGQPVQGIFVCGRRVHRRQVMDVNIHHCAEDALGRPPSEQGRLDLGDGAVYSFSLGAEMAA